MNENPDLPSWLGILRNKGVGRIGDSVARGMHDTLLPAGGEDWVDGEPAEEPLLEMDFDDWPSSARLSLEHELQLRNVEHLWRGHKLLVASRLETTVDDLLDELADEAQVPEPTSATRWCPTCEGEFVAGVTECPDCGVPLVDHPRRGRSAGPVEVVTFDLSAWTDEARLILAYELAGRFPLFDQPLAAVLGRGSGAGLSAPAIPHAWEGTTLVVREVDADRAGAYVAGAEVAFTLGLDPEADKLAYDVDDMSDESLTELLEALVEASIPHELSGDGELFVHEADEDAVEAILDRIDFPDELPAQTEDELENPDDGLEAQAALTDLFDSADRIANDPHNADAILELVEGADRMEGMAVPFGFDRTQWDALRSQAGRLRDAVVADERDVDDVVEQARALRDTLHPLV